MKSLENSIGGKIEPQNLPELPEPEVFSVSVTPSQESVHKDGREVSRQNELKKIRAELKIDQPTGEKPLENLVSPDTLHSEHLNEGVKPIMVAVGTHDELGKTDAVKRIVRDGENVDYWATGKELDKRAIRNGGDGTYVISNLDNKDKFTKGLRNCTGLIASGIDKETGENISFITHQFPNKFLHSKRDEFERDLGGKLSELKVRCKDGTLDVVILGGNYLSTEDRTFGFLGKKDPEGFYQKTYIESIKALAGKVESELGFEPVVAVGPKMTGGTSWGKPIEENIFYDTKERRVYLERQKEQSGIPRSYRSQDIDEESKNWQK